MRKSKNDGETISKLRKVHSCCGNIEPCGNIEGGRVDISVLDDWIRLDETGSNNGESSGCWELVWGSGGIDWHNSVGR